MTATTYRLTLWHSVVSGCRRVGDHPALVHACAVNGLVVLELTPANKAM
jgi:hypothetical protein